MNVVGVTSLAAQLLKEIIGEHLPSFTEEEKNLLVQGRDCRDWGQSITKGSPRRTKCVSKAFWLIDGRFILITLRPILHGTSGVVC